MRAEDVREGFGGSCSGGRGGVGSGENAEAVLACGL